MGDKKSTTKSMDNLMRKKLYIRRGEIKLSGIINEKST